LKLLGDASLAEDSISLLLCTIALASEEQTEQCGGRKTLRYIFILLEVF
jgi:hypothetical protein